MATKKESNLPKDVFSKVASSLMIVSIIYIASISSDIDQLSTDIQLVQQKAEITTAEFRERFDKISNHKVKVENISDRLSKVEWELTNHLGVHEDNEDDNKR